MKICSMLFQDINLEPHSLQPCCDVHGCEVPSFPFSGAEVDMRAYATHISECFKKLQEPDSRLCAGCEHLNNIPDGSLRGVAIKFRTVSINSHRFLCNCKCVYCELWKHREKGIGYSVLPVLKSLFRQKALTENCFISWGGGESSILKDFEETSLWALGKGFFQNVHTNALKYSPAIATLLRNGMGRINISLDAGSRETYNIVKGVDAFDRVHANLRHYMEEALTPQAVQLKYIIFEKNNSPGEIKAFLDLCSGLNISSIQYSLNFKELNSSGPSRETLQAAAFFTVRAKMLGMLAEAFFIPPDIQKEIGEIADSL